MVNKITATNFIGLNVIDAILTKKLMNGIELNPIVRQYLEPDWLFWLIKVGFACVVVAVLSALSDKYPRQTNRVLNIVTIAMLCICIWNSLAIYLS